ncbi:NinE family protein [Escherichia coli]|nr:NinE family protein [Escherichia coli]EIJ1631234.1 NinE family protein [Escherichia coli]EJV7817606.1 NinE family protein [Escherichia coli]
MYQLCSEQGDGVNYTAHLWDIRWLRHRARK